MIFIGNVKLSKRFGHGIPFALGLTFLPAVFAMILGFNSDRFIREKSHKKPHKKPHKKSHR